MVMPPSNEISCAREYWPAANTSSPRCPGEGGGVRRHQNASAASAITGPAPLFSFARCAPASGSMRARK